MHSSKELMWRWFSSQKKQSSISLPLPLHFLDKTKGRGLRTWESSAERQKPAGLSPTPPHTQQEAGSCSWRQAAGFLAVALEPEDGVWELTARCTQTVTDLGLFCDGNQPGVVDTLLRTVCYFFKRVNIELPCDPGILAAYARVLKTHVHTETHARAQREVASPRRHREQSSHSPPVTPVAWEVSTPSAVRRRHSPLKTSTGQIQPTHIVYHIICFFMQKFFVELQISDCSWKS